MRNNVSLWVLKGVSSGGPWLYVPEFAWRD